MARSEVLIALAITLFAALAFADDAVVLTPEKFDEEVGQDRYALIEFFTPWCGHCQKFAPDYERLASGFKKSDTVLIAKAGIVESLDALVKEFVAAANDEREQILTKIEEEVSKFTGTTAQYGKVYVKVAKSVIANYSKVEIERLQRMLQKLHKPSI